VKDGAGVQSTDLFALPSAGHYHLIVADPPWRFEVRNRATGLKRSPDRHYATMTLDGIKALPVAEIAAPDAWLMLWTTWSHLLQAVDLMEAWGFTYCSDAFVWLKLRRGLEPNLFGIQDSDIAMGMGYTTRKASEPCLLGRRGHPRRQSRGVLDTILAPAREHSRKPDEAYRRAEAFAVGPRLDLFARERRPEWDAWGLEVDRF
jgi:N6-adenosine-specific RNA methylase IME4